VWGIERIHASGAWGAVALGIVHLAFTPFTFKSFTLGAFWFFCAGLAIIFAGFLNAAHARVGGRVRLLANFTLVSNLIMAGCFAAIFPLLKQPQAVVGFLLFAVLAVTGVALSRGARA
jgi:hypothetical protein